jgi:uncharacterized cupin superfamily protein
MTASSIRFDSRTPAEPGAPTTAHEWYRSPDGRLTSGFWASTPGSIDVSYDEDEFCQILEGVVRLTDAAGRAETYRAGDSFMIPRGFKGVWETVETVRKFYVVYL